MYIYIYIISICYISSDHTTVTVDSSAHSSAMAQLVKSREVTAISPEKNASGMAWIISQYPLVMSNIAIENVPFIVDLPIKNGDFP